MASAKNLVSSSCYPHWRLYYKTKPCKFFRTGNCRYGKRCRFSHERHQESGVVELLKQLQVVTILTGMQLEDVKEIIKNQNELIKEQALEIGKLKTSLNTNFMSSNELRTARSTQDNYTQCDLSTSDASTNTDEMFVNIQTKITADPVHVSSNKSSSNENIKAVALLPEVRVNTSKKAFDGAICTFHLQGNCKKGTCCDFVHESLSLDDILEWDDTYGGCVIPAKFTGFSYSNGFEITAQLLDKSGHFVSGYPKVFRKRKKTGTPT